MYILESCNDVNIIVNIISLILKMMKNLRDVSIFYKVSIPNFWQRVQSLSYKMLSCQNTANFSSEI